MPLFVIGHSMGGLASALFATMYPRKVNGFVLTGPFVRDNSNMTGGAQGGDDDYTGNALGNLISRDREVVRAYADDPLVEKKISVGLFRRVREAQQWQRVNSAKFTDPVCIMHGGADVIVSPADSLDLYREIASGDKSLHIFSGMYHELYNEPEKDEFISFTVKWLTDRLK